MIFILIGGLPDKIMSRKNLLKDLSPQSDGNHKLDRECTARECRIFVRYVKITNENVLGVSYTLTIEEDSKPPVPNCTYKALVSPRASVILSGSVFADPAIAWRCRWRAQEGSLRLSQFHDEYIPPAV